MKKQQNANLINLNKIKKEFESFMKRDFFKNLVVLVYLYQVSEFVHSQFESMLSEIVLIIMFQNNLAILKPDFFSFFLLLHNVSSS